MEGKPKSARACRDEGKHVVGIRCVPFSSLTEPASLHYEREIGAPKKARDCLLRAAAHFADDLPDFLVDINADGGDPQSPVRLVFGLAWNNLTQDSTIYAGDTLRVAGGSVDPKVAAQVEARLYAQDNARISPQQSSEPVWSFREASMAQRKLDDAQSALAYRAKMDATYGQPTPVFNQAEDRTRPAAGQTP